MDEEWMVAFADLLRALNEIGRPDLGGRLAERYIEPYLIPAVDAQEGGVT